jgi:hypothetical protein
VDDDRSCGPSIASGLSRGGSITCDVIEALGQLHEEYDEGILEELGSI